MKYLLLFLLSILTATAEQELFMDEGAGVFLVRLNQAQQKIEKVIVVKGQVTKQHVTYSRRRFFNSITLEQPDYYRYALVSFRSNGLSSSSRLTWVHPVHFGYKGRNGNVTLPQRLIKKIKNSDQSN